jgi:ferredoxin
MRNKDYELSYSPKSCAGKYYVNCQCLDHDVCRQIAPTLFTRDNYLGGTYVSKQPATEEELRLMKDCIGCCPMQAIRDDGEK